MFDAFNLLQNDSTRYSRVKQWKDAVHGRPGNRGWGRKVAIRLHLNFNYFPLLFFLSFTPIRQEKKIFIPEFYSTIKIETLYIQFIFRAFWPEYWFGISGQIPVIWPGWISGQITIRCNPNSNNLSFMRQNQKQIIKRSFYDFYIHI